MDRPIQVGDLVVVVKAKRCGCPGVIGRVFKVEIVSLHDLPGRCTECSKFTYPPRTPTAQSGIGYIEFNRLKRIPPLSELEGIDETLRETA